MIENIFLAATAEVLSYSMRTPFNQVHDIVKGKLKATPFLIISVFIGIGHADPKEPKLE